MLMVIEMKMWPFEWNYIPFLTYGSARAVCFLLPKCVCFFTNGVYRKLFPVLFITTICVYDFCETVLVNKNTPCQGMIWIFPSKMLYFYTGFLMVLHKLTCEPWNAKKQMSRALPLSSRRDLRAPDPANQGSKKTTSLQTLFYCTYFPGRVLFWHCLLPV